MCECECECESVSECVVSGNKCVVCVYVGVCLAYTNVCVHVFVHILMWCVCESVFIRRFCTARYLTLPLPPASHHYCPLPPPSSNTCAQLPIRTGSTSSQTRPSVPSGPTGSSVQSTSPSTRGDFPSSSSLSRNGTPRCCRTH